MDKRISAIRKHALFILVSLGFASALLRDSCNGEEIYDQLEMAFIGERLLAPTGPDSESASPFVMEFLSPVEKPAPLTKEEKAAIAQLADEGARQRAELTLKGWKKWKLRTAKEYATVPGIGTLRAYLSLSNVTPRQGVPLPPDLPPTAGPAIELSCTFFQWESFSSFQQSEHQRPITAAVYLHPDGPRIRTPQGFGNWAAFRNAVLGLANRGWAVVEDDPVAAFRRARTSWLNRVATAPLVDVSIPVAETLLLLFVTASASLALLSSSARMALLVPDVRRDEPFVIMDWGGGSLGALSRACRKIEQFGGWVVYALALLGPALIGVELFVFWWKEIDQSSAAVIAAGIVVDLLLLVSAGSSLYRLSGRSMSAALTSIVGKSLAVFEIPMRLLAGVGDRLRRRR